MHSGLEGDRKSIVVDAAVYAFAGYLIQPVTILSTILVRRSLGPYLAGVFATLTLFTYYGAFANLGVLPAAERELPYCRGGGDIARFERVRQSAFAVSMISGLIFSLGMVAWAFLRRGEIGEELFLGLMTYAVIVLVLQGTNYFTTLLRVSKDFLFLGKNQAIYGVLGGIASVSGVLLLGFGGLMAAMAVTTVLQAVSLVRFCGYRPGFRVDWKETRALLGLGIPLLVAGLAMTAMRTVDVILVLRLLGTEELGYYTLAVTAGTVVFSVTNSLSVVLFPRMQEAYGRERTTSVLGMYVMRPSVVMAVLLSLAIGVAYFAAPPVVHWLLPNFVPGLPAFRVVLLGTYFLAMVSMSGAALVSMNRQMGTAVLLFGSIAVSSAAAVGFTNRGWGLVGIAVAMTLGYLVCFLTVTAYAAGHWTDRRGIAGFLWNMVLPFACSAPMMLLIDLYRPPWSGTLPASFGLASLKILVFLALSVPWIVKMEPKTHLIEEFVRPVASHLLRRGAGGDPR